MHVKSGRLIGEYTMNRRSFLAMSSTSFVPCITEQLGYLLIGANEQPQKELRPNIVLFLADDAGFADIGCYGNAKVKTPHLDRLAKEGATFMDFHTNGPMCSPTRAALLTGRYQQRTGVDGVGDLLHGDEIVIAQRLRSEAGYATGIFGKWHVSGHNRNKDFYKNWTPNRFGFSEFVGFMGGFVDYNNHLTDRGKLDWWHNDTLIEEKGYASPKTSVQQFLGYALAG